MPSEEAHFRDLRHHPEEPRILLVVAHPDDEIIGCGVRLSGWHPDQVAIVHATDGAPRDLEDVHHAGYAHRQDYARVRRRELETALALAGIGPERCLQVGFFDKEAYLHLVTLTERIVTLMAQAQPDIVITHPYEGGHPDHDATAFAVAYACRRAGKRPEVQEFASYHESPSGFVTGQFLNNGDSIQTLTLSPEQRDLKRRMFDCFVSQKHVLRDFRADVERLRPAPRYDFSRPPHAGTLHYEKLPWGITSERWCAQAIQASKLLSGAAGT